MHEFDLQMINNFMHKCKFCDKDCNTIKSYRVHEDRCKMNPNRIDPASWAIGNRKGMKGSNAYLKARALDLPEPIMSDEARKKMSESATIRNQNESIETRNKRQKTIADKVADGSWHTSLARHMHIDYNGIDLHGSWELAYAKYLDYNHVSWIRNKDSFTYVFEDKERKYTPDFYLIDEDVYVEIKGYKTEKDDAKWSQFPAHRKLKILLREDLVVMNII